MDFFVVLSGRRVDLDNGHYTDYIGHGYPFELRFDTSPLFLSNLLIKRVVSRNSYLFREAVYQRSFQPIASKGQ